MSALRINISRLSEGTHHYSLKAAPDEVGLDARITKELQIGATLEKTSRQLSMCVEVKTGGIFTCDRCLEEYQQDVSSGYRVLFVTDDSAGASVNDEVQVISSDTSHIDLAEDVRQFVLLGLPQKMLCREDCAGLCPICGSNLNRGKCDCRNDETGSRWSELEKILKN